MTFKELQKITSIFRSCNFELGCINVFDKNGVYVGNLMEKGLAIDMQHPKVEALKGVLEENGISYWCRKFQSELELQQALDDAEVPFETQEELWEMYNDD